MSDEVSMVRWEYLGVSVDTRMRAIGNWVVTEPVGLKGPWPEARSRLGYEGWELVVGLPEMHRNMTNLEHAHFVFKRQVQG
ncbi:MAG TPA: hypothetical protein VFI47_06630 [Acidimicrobiales bacterium]|nr:hypothetical protein [Acidimicrobiales bacterium]